MPLIIVQPEQDDVPNNHELVHGRLVKLSPPNAYTNFVTNRLNTAMIRCEAISRIGRSRMGMYFRLPTPDDPTRICKPSLTFVKFLKWPHSMPIPYTGNAIGIVPDLAVEVINPNDKAEVIIEKMRDCLQASVRSVWIVYPRSEEIHCYEGEEHCRIFKFNDTLDGGAVLPGFSVAVASLFPPIIPGSIPASKDE